MGCLSGGRGGAPFPRRPLSPWQNRDHRHRTHSAAVYSYGMPTAILFVDTNVLLHFTFFDEIDWRSLVPADQAIVTLCPAVLHELDEKKFAGGSQRIRERASRVVKRLGNLLKDDTPVVFRQGCQVWAPSREPTIDYAANGLDKSVTDDQILACAIEKPAIEGEVVVVTADVGLRLKANARRIKTQMPPGEWRLPDELGDTERKLKQTQQELAALKAAAPQLCLVFRDGNTLAEFRVRQRPEPMAEQVETRIAKLRKKYPKYETAKDPLGIGMPAMLSPTPHDYNRALEGFFERYAAYMREAPHVFERHDRTIRLDLTLDNSGTRAADDVDIVLVTDADAEWRRSRALVEPAPSAPSPPLSILEAGYRNLDFLGPMPTIGASTADNASGPILCKDDPGEVHFHVGRVKAGFPVPLPRVYLEFRSFDSASSFEVQWTMAAQNIAKPERGVLRVKVTN